jgi:DNA-binding transcriptional MerR regulator
LVTPSHRTSGGHRLYTDEDIERLYRVLALRRLGLPLGDIATVLDGGQPLAEVLEQHLAQTRGQLAAVRALCLRLASAVEATRTAVGPSATDLLALIDEVRRVDETIKQYFDAEQLSALEERRVRVGEDRIAEVQERWPTLIAQVQAAVDADMSPQEPVAQQLAAEWMGLLESFHGGDPGLRDSLYRMQAENADQIRAEHAGPSPEAIAFITAANAARGG